MVHQHMAAVARNFERIIPTKRLTNYTVSVSLLSNTIHSLPTTHVLDEGQSGRPAGTCFMSGILYPALTADLALLCTVHV